MKDGNLRIRAVEPEDTQIIYDWENDPEIWRVGNTFSPVSLFAIEQFVLNFNQSIYQSNQMRMMIDIIEENGNHTCIGTIDIFDFDSVSKRAAIGILIDKAFRNKGYATRTLNLIIDYCENILMLNQVYCNIFEDNELSIKLFTNAGFVKCGVLKKWTLKNKTWFDEIIMQKIF